MKAVKYLCTFLSIAFVTLNTHAQITISMKNENGVYTVPCKVNGLKLKFIFDTGASSVSISLTEASFMLKNDYLSLDDIIGTSNYLDANGDINLGVDVILRELEIGGLKLTDVKAKVVNNIKAPLLLGQTAISKLGVIQLNLDSNQLIILNNDKPASPQNLDKVDTIMASDSSALNDFVKLAWNSIDNEDYDEAIFLCNKAINENVKNNIAYIARGVAFDSKKEFELAIEDYTTAIKLNLKDGETYCYRGETLGHLYKYNEALVDLNKGLSLSPKYKQGYKWRADIKQKKSDFLGAIQDINKAILLGPTDSILYLTRGKIKNDLKDYKNAILDFNKIIKGDPTNHQAYLFRGDSKVGLKDYSDAKIDYEKSIEYFPDNPEVYTARGRLKEILKDYYGAMEDYDKAIELDSTYLWAILSKELLSKKIEKDTWIKIGDGKNNQKYYISKSVISNYQSIIKIWVKMESPLLDVSIRGKKVQYKNGYELWLMNFDCSSQRLKFLSTHSYDSKGKAVKQLDEYDGGFDWGDVIPDSVGEFLLKKVCEKYN